VEAQPIFPAYGYATTTVLISVLAAMSSWVRSLLGLNDPQHSSRRTEAGDSKDRCSHSDNNCPQLNDWDNDPGNTDKGDDEQPVDDQLDSTAIEDFLMIATIKVKFLQMICRLTTIPLISDGVLHRPTYSY